MLLEEEKKEILAQLSLRAEFYLEYLTRLAWLHGLLVPMPSIHTQRVQPASECDAFFAQPTADILFQLGESACTLEMCIRDRLHGNSSVESTGTQQCLIQCFGSVRCRQNNNTLSAVKAVHLRQQLVQGLLPLIVAAHAVAVTLFPDGRCV